MGDSAKSSVLEYARFYGIASDYTAVDPLAYINDTCRIPTPELQSSPVIEQLQIAQQTATQTLLNEKLDIKKEGARLLTTVIRDAGAQTKDIDWADVLSAFDRTERLQVEKPIFPAEHDMNTMLARRRLRYEECDIPLEPLDELPSVAPLPSQLADNMNQVIDHARSEKLGCSKNAFTLIQSARDCASPSMKCVESLLMDELKPCQGVFDFPEPSPLILSDVEDAYLRSPSPITSLHMLPSSTSSPLPPEYSSQRSQPGAFENQKHGRSKKTQVDMVPCLFDDHTKEGSGFVEPEDSLHGSLGCNTFYETSLSSQNSVNGNQNSNSNTQTVLDAPNHTDSTPPIFSRSSLDIDAQSCASVNCLARADSPPEKNISDTHENAAFSSKGTPTDSPGKDLSTAEEELFLPATESLSSRQSADNETSLESTGHFSCSKDESNISWNSIRAISPLQPICEVTGPERGFEGQSRDNVELKTLQGTHLQLKYKGFSDHRSLLPQKRERSKSQESFQPRGKHCHQGEKPQKDTPDAKVLLPLQASLGSLASFMEIRGRNRSRRPVVATSQYVADSQPTDHIKQYDSIVNTEDTKLVPVTFIDRVPQIQRKVYQQSYLYVSTTLLKSHLNLVQYIEKTQSAPTIIYRDYGATVKQSHPGYSPRGIPIQSETRPDEADIIVSPTTGIILTTSQAITQLYLPGHKPKNPKIAGLKCINSPLREQIFLLASRYEHLYLLISHSAGSRIGSQEGSAGLTWTADQRTLASFASLLAFCNSISDCTIIPLWVPFSTEMLAKWVLSLHDKHAVELPPSCAANSRQIGFTPVNPKPQSQLTRAEHGSMEETNWEHFLRRVGLNPYAARAVLAVLDKGIAMQAEGDSSSHTQGKSGSLSRFMGMSSERRRELFGKLIGEKMVNRVSLVIEKDWQCDWALDFNESAKL